MNTAEWQRLCDQSLRRSQSRREEISLHPWPQRISEWIGGLMLAAAFLFVVNFVLGVL